MWLLPYLWQNSGGATSATHPTLHTLASNTPNVSNLDKDQLLMALLPGELRVLNNLWRIAPNLVVDVGAGMGEHAEEITKRYHGVQVASFDPQAGTCAIGAEDGTLEMTLLPYNFSRSTGAKKYLQQLYIPFSVKRVVPLFRLDSLFTEEIDLLKVDVEGMAWDVLVGLGALRPKVVQFEWGFAEDMEKHTLGDFAHFFAPWGYKVEELDWDSNYGNYLAATPERLRLLR